MDAEASSALALVPLDPLVEELDEPDRPVFLQHTAVPIGLAFAFEPPRSVVGRRHALPLPPGHHDHGDVADRRPASIDAAVDTGHLGLPQPPLVACGWTISASRPSLNTAHELPLVSRAAGRSSGAVAISLVAVETTWTGSRSQALGTHRFVGVCELGFNAPRLLRHKDRARPVDTAGVSRHSRRASASRRWSVRGSAGERC